MKKKKRNRNYEKQLCKMKNDRAEIKNTQEGINSRLKEAEDGISELKDSVEKAFSQRTKKKKQL